MPGWKPEIRRRLARLQLAPTCENAIVEELAQHLDESYEELLACGMSEAEARRQALTDLNEDDLLARELRRVERQVAPEPIILGTNRRTNRGSFSKRTEINDFDKLSLEIKTLRFLLQS